jgi:hypothetical protein
MIPPWRTVDPARAGTLVDARLQLHHAAQFAAALGISYLEKRADDSHTNMEWIASLGALASNRAGPEQIRIAIRIDPLAVLVLDASDHLLAELPLDWRTMSDAMQWIRARVAECGLDPARYTTARHYIIPPHPVGESQPFNAHARDAFAELSAWYGNAAEYFTALAARTRNASPVRCWPHHFDIGLLFEPETGKTIGVGMDPGDDDYAEPYWYANVYPGSTSSEQLPQLDAGGMWHTGAWIGAVLTGSQMRATEQPAQVAAFFDSAFRAYGASEVDATEDPRGATA